MWASQVCGVFLPKEVELTSSQAYGATFHLQDVLGKQGVKGGPAEGDRRIQNARGSGSQKMGPVSAWKKEEWDT